MIDLDTWIISDTHFYHANIVKYCGRPENHTELIYANWRAVVKEEDTILHLGDLAMGKSSEAKALLASLPGNKLFIRGNHDHKAPHWYREAGFKFVGDGTGSNGHPLGSIRWDAPDGTRVLFTHYPHTKWYHDWDVNIHGHIHNNGYSPETPDLDFRNVSVEVVNYMPVRLRDVLYGDAFSGRHDRPDWSAQTQNEKQTKGGVILPDEKQTGYYGQVDDLD
jgi:calcineurin-like phosphoesterase family protein